MAKIKVPKVKDLSGYFFMSIEGNIVDIVYHDNTENGLAIGAAFASALEKDKQLFKVLSAAMITILNEKEKYSSKTAKKVTTMVSLDSTFSQISTKERRFETLSLSAIKSICFSILVSNCSILCVMGFLAF